MFSNQNKLPFKIKNSIKLYSIRQKLTGKGTPGVQLKKINAEPNEDYKLIQLNLYGKVTGFRRRIIKVQKNLAHYKKSDSVPNLIYTDTDRIILEWIDGERFDKLKKGKQDYIDLAEFNARNVINFKKIPLNTILDLRINQIRELKKINAISSHTEDSVMKFFDVNQLPGSDYIGEALCFADSALKNYIKVKNGSLVYIDVFGIQRRQIGRVFAKQITQIPGEYRKVYADAYSNTLPGKIKTTLPFSYLNYLITRLYSNVIKWNIMDYKGRKKKTETALSDLKSFLEAADNNEPLEEWIFKHS